MNYLINSPINFINLNIILLVDNHPRWIFPPASLLVFHQRFIKFAVFQTPSTDM